MRPDVVQGWSEEFTAMDAFEDVTRDIVGVRT